MKIGLFLNPKKDQSLVTGLIKEECDKRGYIIDNENPDIVIFVGGDGTFLRAVQHYIDKLDTINFVGVNDGTLCFFFDYTDKDISHLFRKIEKEEYVVTPHRLLKGHLVFENDDEEDIFAVNEIRLESPFHTLIADVDINEDHLETFHGNGLIICSSSGSTAYNKSLGGAVVDPSLDLLELTEIATIQNNVIRSLGSPLIVSGEKNILITGDFRKEVVGYDYMTTESNQRLISMLVTLSDKRVNMIHANTRSWIKALKRSFVK